MATPAKAKFLLLQVRNPDDPMRQQEVRCFVRALNCRPEQIQVRDLLAGPPTFRELKAVDVVLLGGSGDYSVAEGGPWLADALAAMQSLYDLEKAVFASCWGFQAMARALGGEVVTDLSRAELGTLPIRLQEAAKKDAVFGHLPDSFFAAMGHQDIVTRLPDQARLLASTDRVAHQAFCCPGKPIYCTQFHPELDLRALLERVRTYPWYVERIAGMPLDEFAATCRETPDAATLLPRFVEFVFGHAG